MLHRGKKSRKFTPPQRQQSVTRRTVTFRVVAREAAETKHHSWSLLWLSCYLLLQESAFWWLINFFTAGKYCEQIRSIWISFFFRKFSSVCPNIFQLVKGHWAAKLLWRKFHFMPRTTPNVWNILQSLVCFPSFHSKAARGESKSSLLSWRNKWRLRTELRTHRNLIINIPEFGHVL